MRLLRKSLPSVEKVGREYNRVLNRRLPSEVRSDESLPFIFRLPQSAIQWIKYELAPQAGGERSRADVYNLAIQLGGFLRLSRRLGAEPCLRAPDGGTRNLPPFPERMPAHEVSGRVRAGLGGQALHWMVWGERQQCRIPLDDLAYSGVHILGALAAMPAQSALAVVDQSGVFGLQGRTDIHLADPYPPDLYSPSASSPEG